MFVLGCYFQQFQGFILKLVARDFGHRKCVQVSLILAHIGTLILMNLFLQMNWSIIYVVDSPHVWFCHIGYQWWIPLDISQRKWEHLGIDDLFVNTWGIASSAGTVPLSYQWGVDMPRRFGGGCELGAPHFSRHLNHHVSPCLPRLSLRMRKGDFGDWLCWFLMLQTA